eukprot:gene31944-40331_t
MDSLSDAEELSARIEALRASEALQSFLEKLAAEGAVTFTQEETTLASQPSPPSKTVVLYGLLTHSTFSKLRREATTAISTDKSGNDSNAAKRTWDFANKADELFFRSKAAMAKAAKSMPESIAEEYKENLKKAEEALDEGMQLCEDKAQLAHIAFKDGWNVATKFADEPVTNSDEAEKRYKKAKKEASAEAAANAESRKARNGWKARS